MPNEEDRTDISVSAIYGHKTRRGMVEMQLGDVSHQMLPAKAREIAVFLLEAAGAAEGDEALMRILERSGEDEQRAAQMLMALRIERGSIDQQARDEARRAVAQDQFNPDIRN